MSHKNPKHTITMEKDDIASIIMVNSMNVIRNLRPYDNTSKIAPQILEEVLHRARREAGLDQSQDSVNDTQAAKEEASHKAEKQTLTSLTSDPQEAPRSYQDILQEKLQALFRAEAIKAAQNMTIPATETDAKEFVQSAKKISFDAVEAALDEAVKIAIRMAVKTKQEIQNSAIQNSEDIEDKGMKVKSIMKTEEKSANF